MEKKTVNRAEKIALLVVMQIDTTTMENSMEMP